MPSIAELNRGDHDAFIAALGGVFEHSPWVAEHTWSRRPFRDAAQLHAELCATLHAAAHEQQLNLIRAHPDLAGRLAREKQLTAASAHEQSSAGLDQLTPDEQKEFAQLNERYRTRFGFPFVICARLNQKPAILDAMQRRIENTPGQEFDAALAEIEKIARLRLDALLQS